MLRLSIFAVLAGLLMPATKPSSLVPTGGKLAVHTRWEGERPQPLPPLNIDPKTAEGCVAEGETIDATNRDLRIASGGGVSDVVITLTPQDPAAKKDASAETYVLDQKHCHFEPHVLVVPAGSSVRYENGDGVTHNVHTYSLHNKVFNSSVGSGSSELRTLDHPEIVTVKCDIHSWMKGFVYVTDAPYFGTTDADGSLELDQLPAGTYEAAWWHPTLGKGKLDPVTIAEGETSILELPLKARHKHKRKHRR